MSAQISYKKQIVFGIIGIILVLAVIEAAANVWWYEINRCAFEDKEIFKDLDEDTKRKLCLESYNLQYTDIRISSHEGIMNINSDGFRGDEISKNKPANTYRIFVVGGSTTLGIGVLDDQTIPFHLEKLFEGADLEFNVEVINAGINAAWSETETKMIKERLLNYEPDLFIVYDGFNDIEHQTGVQEKYAGETTDEQDWKNRWIEICDLGKQENFETVIIMQPFVGTGYRVLTDQEYEMFIQHANFLNAYLPHVSSYVEQLKELDQHCTATMDLTNAFDKYPEPIYFDIVHVGTRGNQIIAQNMFDIVLPIVLENSNKINSENSIPLQIETNNKSTSNNNFNIIQSYKTPRIISHFLSGGFNEDENKNIVPKEKNFDGMDLSEENFEGRDLSGATFYFSDLSNTNFRNADLSNAEFRFAKMENVDLRHANLRDAKFPRIHFFQVDFRDADFTNAYLSGARFTKSLGNNANFKDAYLVSTVINTVNFTSGNFENADFKNTSMQYVDMRNSNIFNANFKDSTLMLTFFNNLDFANVDLSYSDLPGSEFRNVKLEGANIENIDFTGKGWYADDGSTFMTKGTDLSHTDLSRIILPKNVLFFTFNIDTDKPEIHEMAKKFAPVFIETNFSDQDLSERNMSYSDLTNAKFVNSNLSDAILIHVNLSGADLQNANLTNTNLENANLEGANLNGAILNCINHSICN